MLRPTLWAGYVSPCLSIYNASTQSQFCAPCNARTHVRILVCRVLLLLMSHERAHPPGPRPRGNCGGRAGGRESLIGAAGGPRLEVVSTIKVRIVRIYAVRAV